MQIGSHWFSYNNYVPSTSIASTIPCFHDATCVERETYHGCASQATHMETG